MRFFFTSFQIFVYLFWPWARGDQFLWCGDIMLDQKNKWKGVFLRPSTLTTRAREYVKRGNKMDKKLENKVFFYKKKKKKEKKKRVCFHCIYCQC